MWRAAAQFDRNECGLVASVKELYNALTRTLTPAENRIAPVIRIVTGPNVGRFHCYLYRGILRIYRRCYQLPVFRVNEISNHSYVADFFNGTLTLRRLFRRLQLCHIFRFQRVTYP